jgi:predicted DCC family thiol-disulfide oxidoreductase YuxK
MSETPVTVLYDGGCPMCSREIDHYRRVAADRPIDWVDVTRPDADLSRFGVNRREALEVFHVVDSAGTMHTGARAFIALWAELPGYRWLARACRTLRAAPLLDAAYRRFAAWHFARRCRDGACGLGGEEAGG